MDPAIASNNTSPFPTNHTALSPNQRDLPSRLLPD